MTENPVRNDLLTFGDKSGEITETRQSKLQQVLEHITSRKDIYLAGVIVQSNYMGLTEAASVVVAPVKPIYDAEKLNKFMQTICPDMTRACHDDATNRRDGGIDLGKLYFDEDLGKSIERSNTTFVVYESEPLIRAGIKIEGISGVTERILKRRTWVRMYPNANVAQVVADYEKGQNDGSIEPDSRFDYMDHWLDGYQMEQIKKTGTSPFSKITALFGK